MILHLGDGVAVYSATVIAIFDLSKMPLAANSPLSHLRDVRTISITNAPHCAVLTASGESLFLYESPISAATLSKRCNQPRTKRG